MTVATEIYATGVHPYDGQAVCVARTPEEKQEQRSFFFWYKPEMKAVLRATLHRLGLKNTAARLLDGRKTTVDVTPPPHITPCQQSGRRFAAATQKPERPSHLPPTPEPPPAAPKSKPRPPPPLEKFFKKKSGQ
jgi:hypothetical protein